MKLFTKPIEAKLLANSKLPKRPDGFVPVVKFFTPFGGATWLITDMDEDGYMFGLCDMGMGCPEMGDVHRSEFENAGIRIERDMYWSTDKTIGELAREAKAAGGIR